MAFTPAWSQGDTGDVWTKLTTGTTAALSGVACPGVDVCYAVGDNGTLLKTADTGKTWTAQNSGVTVPLHAVRFLGRDTGYVSGTGRVLKTVNGGATWTAVRTSGGAYIAFDCKNASLCAAASNGTTGIRTTDGGATWSNMSSGVASTVSYEMQFVGSGTLWQAGAEGVAARSTAEGSGSWSANLGPSVTNDIYAMQWRSADSGWVGTLGERVYSTTNGGTSWTSRHTGAGSGYFNALRFATRNVGYAVGTAVVKSTNGGANWSAQTIPAFTTLRDIAFPDTALGYAVGLNGGIWKLRRPGYVPPQPPEVIEAEEPLAVGSDTGDVWTLLNSGTTSVAFSGVSCPMKNVCYAVGGNGDIRKTTDTGNTWTVQSSGTASTLHAVQFLGADTGYVSGTGVILKTVDGGATWAPVRSTGAAYIGLACRSSSHCVAASSGSTALIATTDGGATWSAPALSVSPAQLYEVRFTPDNAVWSAGEAGILLKNPQSGTGTWSGDLGPAAWGDVYSMYWHNSDTGWVGTTGLIHRTTNGGTSWTSKATDGTSGYWNAIVFPRPKIGYAVGATMSRTRNRGGTWSKIQASPAIGPLRDIVFPDTALGFAVGTNGAIWRIKRPGFIGPPSALQAAKTAMKARAFVGLRHQGAGVGVSSEGRVFDMRGRGKNPVPREKPLEAEQRPPQ